MVSKQDDNINFEKLEQEALNAFEADARYYRENDAKFRAVNQRVATYDEFRDIVLASHIKPLEKNDHLNPKDFKQQWNSFATKKETEIGSKTKNSSKESSDAYAMTIPKNGHEFTKEWRRKCKSPVDKYNVLLELGGETLGKIFKSEISFGLLGEFVDVLLLEYKQTDWESIFYILQHLCKTNRFQLSVEFMSGKEKEACKQLFDQIQHNMGGNESTGDISLQAINDTRKKYGLEEIITADS